MFHENYFNNEILKLIGHRFRVNEVSDGIFDISRRGKRIRYNVHTAKFTSANKKVFDCGVEEFLINLEKNL